uniref:Centrosomin N-terminal motif 1 domain-containing protein n=1 Tax=Trichuris muris TaxID=70415 RepID=A0A5S6QCU1_TRIMR
MENTSYRTHKSMPELSGADDENSTEGQSIRDLLSPSFDLNAAYRPRNLERTVEAFKRENFRLRVEVYYLKTRLCDAGLTFRSPDPEQYKLDAVALAQKLEEKEREIALVRDEAQKAKIALSEDIAQLESRLEKVSKENQAFENLRLKCEQLERQNRETTVSLSHAKRENVLLRDAILVMNECAPENDSKAILNSEKDRKISELNTELLLREQLMKTWRNDTRAIDTTEQKETSLSTQIMWKPAPSGEPKKPGSGNGWQNGQTEADASIKDERHLPSKITANALPNGLPTDPQASSSLTKRRRLPMVPLQECKKCKNYERLFASIGRSISGDDENEKYISLTKDQKKLKLMISCLHKINTHLRKRMQESCSMLKKINKQTAIAGFNANELVKLSVLHDAMLKDLNRAHSLISKIEIYVLNGNISPVDSSNDKEFLHSKDRNVESPTSSKRSGYYGLTTGSSEPDDAMLAGTLEMNGGIPKGSDTATQTENVPCQDVGLQCRRAFDVEQFSWPDLVVLKFPWLQPFTSDLLSFLDIVAGVLDGDISEQDKQAYIASLCDHFRVYFLPLLQSFLAEKSHTDSGARAIKVERVQTVDSLIEDTVTPDEVGSALAEAVRPNCPSCANAAVAFDLHSGRKALFNIYSQLKCALQLLQAVQQPWNGINLKLLLRDASMNLQLAISFAESLLFRMSRVGLAGESNDITENKLGWILHSLNRALANVRNDSVLMGSRLRRTDGSVAMLVHENYELRAKLNHCKGSFKNKQLELAGNSKYVYRQNRDHALITEQGASGHRGSPHRSGKVNLQKR